MCVSACVCDPFSVRYAHSSSGIIFVSGIWYGWWAHELFFSVNSNCRVSACANFVLFLFVQTIKSMKICLNRWQLLTCYRLSQLWQWCDDDVDEWKQKKKLFQKNQEIIPFLSGLHLCQFFSVSLCFVDIIINILCVFLVAFIQFFFHEENEKMESSILFSIIIFFYGMILSWWVCIQYLYKYLFAHFYGVYAGTHWSKHFVSDKMCASSSTCKQQNQLFK